MKKEKIDKKEKKEKKKLDKVSIFRKILAASLLVFILLGTCYTFIYLVVNA